MSRFSDWNEYLRGNLLFVDIIALLTLIKRSLLIRPFKKFRLCSKVSGQTLLIICFEIEEIKYILIGKNLLSVINHVKNEKYPKTFN